MRPDDSEIELSVIVPCYNEGPTLLSSLQRLTTWLSRHVESWEVIFVDDGSLDSSRETVDQFIADNPDLRLRAKHHERNSGRGSAVMDGVAVADGEIVGFLDIDLEVAEHFIGLCLDAIRDGADVVTGRRVYRQSLRAMHREILSRGYVALVRAILGTRLEDTESGFKWFRRDRIQDVLAIVESKGWFFDTEIMILAERSGLTIREVPVLFLRRDDKKSTVRAFRDSVVYFRQLLAFRRRLAASLEPIE